MIVVVGQADDLAAVKVFAVFILPLAGALRVRRRGYISLPEGIDALLALDNEDEPTCILLEGFREAVRHQPRSFQTVFPAALAIGLTLVDGFLFAARSRFPPHDSEKQFAIFVARFVDGRFCGMLMVDVPESRILLAAGVISTGRWRFAMPARLSGRDTQPRSNSAVRPPANEQTYRRAQALDNERQRPNATRSPGSRCTRRRRREHAAKGRPVPN